MHKYILAISLIVLSLPALAQAPTCTPIATVKGPVGSLIPVTVYIACQSIAPMDIVWSGTGVTCTANGTGFNCVGNTVGTFNLKATHTNGTFANLLFQITAGLQFSSP